MESEVQASSWLPGRKPELAPRLPGLCFGLPSTSGQPDTNPSIHLTDNGKTGLSFVPSWNAKARSAQRVEYGLCESRGGSKGLLLASRGRMKVEHLPGARWVMDIQESKGNSAKTFYSSAYFIGQLRLQGRNATGSGGGKSSVSSRRVLVFSSHTADSCLATQGLSRRPQATRLGARPGSPHDKERHRVPHSPRPSDPEGPDPGRPKRPRQGQDRESPAG
ncbi:uncharacterized protein LOC111186535 [Delphinapterus leucas]|uniref:Uncharacterized protein LOC111186535 n=1 Tax=Delphinapterus leucas TaxID=9749 RepID=A0A7F8KCC2_DELLE|nr:uncharacterized protein LOC111186535 [Delphinapterus leucas]